MSEQWSVALLFLAGGVKAGLTLEEALDALENEAPEPLKSMFKSSVGDNPTWVPFAQRVERLFVGPDLALARAALVLSHQVGGQAAPLLEQCATTLQLKLELADRLNALTAQSRWSAWVVGLTPFFLLLGFSVFAYEFVVPLFQTSQGRVLLTVAILLVLIGLIGVHRMARLEW